MYKNYSAESVDIKKISNMVNKIIEKLDSVPYFFSFAILNKGDEISGKTEYKVFYKFPYEAGLSLHDDKFEKISRIYDIPYTEENSMEEKNVKLERNSVRYILDEIDEIIYFCKDVKIPCFIGIMKSNNKKENDMEPSTKYIFDMVAPDECRCDLYDDRINKILRYTLNTNIYPEIGAIRTRDIPDFDPGSLGGF
jgi:hypothetical protein